MLIIISISRFNLKDKSCRCDPLVLGIQCTYQDLPFLKLHESLIYIFVLYLLLHFSWKAIFDSLADDLIWDVFFVIRPVGVVKLFIHLDRRRYISRNTKQFIHTFIILEDYYLEVFCYIIHEIPNIIIEDDLVLLTHIFASFKPYLPIKIFASFFISCIVFFAIWALIIVKWTKSQWENSPEYPRVQ